MGVTSFLNTIINNLPVGVTLALEVAGKEKFESRYIVSADPGSPGTVTQHLLDGQQRLTAFWRSMHNNYESETYFVYLPQFDREVDAVGGRGRGALPAALEQQTWTSHAALGRRAGEVFGTWTGSRFRSCGQATCPRRSMDGFNATKPLKPLPTDADAFSKLEAFNGNQGEHQEGDHNAAGASHSLQSAVSIAAVGYGEGRCATGIHQHEYQQQAA